MIKFISENKEWLLSGLGSGLIFWLIGRKQGHEKAIKQIQKMGNQGRAIQVGGNLNQIFTRSTDKRD